MSQGSYRQLQYGERRHLHKVWQVDAISQRYVQRCGKRALAYAARIERCYQELEHWKQELERCKITYPIRKFKTRTNTVKWCIGTFDTMADALNARKGELSTVVQVGDKWCTFGRKVTSRASGWRVHTPQPIRTAERKVALLSAKLHKLKNN